ncbi:DUF2948 family protein [Primorskyibacter flagellatus]|uniref:DUF2948 family protein n=1 Tax=Primorskyibacter flagellatus TaxID=1387277 RepID=A0A1W2AV32_9RHOB|nr:DUF2948 family protein [Primorskyibacter flagellatus]SMC64579.1 Protein of unknown function [Primorskyibacter flagellatus]
MTDDAKFEDGGDRPLNLGALDVEDLTVLSSLAQDAVFPITEMRWDRGTGRLALLVNRFRWEDLQSAGQTARSPERVQSVLMIENVHRVGTQGIDPKDRDTVLSLLALTFEATDAPSGNVILTLAGDGAIRAEVEALDIRLRDVTRPYLAPSRQAPRHPE